MKAVLPIVCCSLALAPVAAAQPGRAPVYDVKSYGATGSAKAADTTAINRAIDAAHAAGGRDVVNSPIFVRLGRRLRSPTAPRSATCGA